MKVTRTLSAAVAAALIVVALAAAFELGVVPLGGRHPSSTTCMGCGQQETVVDVIMPYFGTAGNTTNPDRVVNMTQGSSRTLEVDVYPTSGLGFVLGFSSLLVTQAPGTGSQGSTAQLSAFFQPSSLTVGANAKGVAFMTVTVPATAIRGTYDAVVSATNQGNSSQVWGLYFEIDVL